MNTEQINSAAEHLCTCRDFCGNEREAFAEWCADNGVKDTPAHYRLANFRANAIWNRSQRQAGVPEKYLF